MGESWKGMRGMGGRDGVVERYGREGWESGGTEGDILVTGEIVALTMSCRCAEPTKHIGTCGMRLQRETHFIG